MTILEMIEEWRKGCSCSTEGHPEECHDCTVVLIEAIEKRYKKDEVESRIRNNAYKSLVNSKEQQILHLQGMLKGYEEARRTLQSEREANAILTEELESLRAK